MVSLSKLCTRSRRKIFLMLLICCCCALLTELPLIRVQTKQTGLERVSGRSWLFNQKGVQLPKTFNLLYNSSYLTKLIGTSDFPVTADDNRKYLIENQQLCSSVEELSFLLIVHTSPRNTHKRDLIRIWISESNFDYRYFSSIKVLFLLGSTSDESVQDHIVKESKQFGDILQGDFTDTYRNLTNKGVLGYKWLAERCQNVPIIVKMDDDVIFDVVKMLDIVIPFIKGRSKMMVCFHAYTMGILRERGTKWFVNDTFFRGQDTYPPYCAGFFVVFTNDLSPILYQAAKTTPFFWVDDVYLYGLLPNRVPNLEVFTLKNMCLGDDCVHKCKQPSYVGNRADCDFLVVGNLDHHTLVEQWTMFQGAANNRLKKYIDVNYSFESLQKQL